MPRACTICTHSECAAIDRVLVDGVSLRNIAKRFGPSPASLTRHKNGCLARLLAEVTPVPFRNDPVQPAPIVTHVEQRQTADRAHAIDILAELSTQIARVNMLSDAVDVWLRDPDDPARYDIGPRAENVTVVYTVEVDPQFPPQRRKAPLQELLNRVEAGVPGASIVSWETKHADPRELLLKAADGLKGQLTLMASILEKLSSAGEVETFRAIVLEAIGEVAPDVRDAIADRLSRRHALLAGRGRPR